MLDQTYSKSPMHEVIDELFGQVHLIARFGTIALKKGKDVGGYQIRIDKLNLKIMENAQSSLSGEDLKRNKATIKYLLQKIEDNKEDMPTQKGVYFHEKTSKWCAQIKRNDKRIHLGLFNYYEDAVIARKEAE